MNLVVGDYFKLKLVYEKYVNMALELIKWINNHLFALGQLRAHQELQRRIALILVLPVLTRWTTHLLAMQRLLALRPFIEAMVASSRKLLVDSAGKTKEARQKAETVLSYVGDKDFWAGIERYVPCWPLQGMSGVETDKLCAVFRCTSIPSRLRQISCKPTVLASTTSSSVWDASTRPTRLQPWRALCKMAC